MKELEAGLSGPPLGEASDDLALLLGSQYGANVRFK